MSREMFIPAKTMTEEITAIQHILGQSVMVSTQLGEMVTENGTPFFKGVTATGNFFVQDADYAELMSASPSWAPTKPAGVFRMDDLWHYVDKYRVAQVALSILASEAAAKGAADAQSAAV